MRCVCCNANLNDYESTRKSKVSGDYLDMCNRCFDFTDIDAEDRDDLPSYEVPDDEIEFLGEDDEEDI